jgi:hypothetical protein
MTTKSRLIRGSQATQVWFCILAASLWLPLKAWGAEPCILIALDATTAAELPQLAGPVCEVKLCHAEDRAMLRREVDIQAAAGAGTVQAIAWGDQ